MLLVTCYLCTTQLTT
ncbi:unnamed protein product [Euphydryas editha]|uniref:Uncharacterized protein n=1 Tax=Euphydryas editha TaxID=104508 RepID=A0AAU9VA02_EUPED|nr:unnamed protein product [Euphydryas editha]